MQNLESDNILDWLLQVSGQAGRVAWYDCLGGLLYRSDPPPLTLISHLVSGDVT